MCGRFTLTTPDQITDELGVAVPTDAPARYNVCPTDPVIAIANRGERRAEWMRWGLVPHWADSPAIGAKLINARAETAADKPAFRDALARRRCLIPASGFYEWKREGKLRRPFYVRRADRRLLVLAGLWERWKPPGGDWLISCSIVTTAANPPVAAIHDRMPVVVSREDHERWLFPEPLPAAALADILGPAPEASLEMYEVRPLVNSVKNEGASLIEPLAAPGGA
jgi:putative SOS response-associated peptidase YedK